MGDISTVRLNLVVGTYSCVKYIRLKLYRVGQIDAFLLKCVKKDPILVLDNLCY